MASLSIRYEHQMTGTSINVTNLKMDGPCVGERGQVQGQEYDDQSRLWWHYDSVRNIIVKVFRAI